MVTRQTPTDLGARIFDGALWTVFMRFLIRSLSFVSLLILARVFSPEEFGLIAKAVLFREILETLTQFGLQAALIRDRDASEEDFHTAWTLSIFRGALIGGVLVLGSFFITDFFNEPRLLPIIWCYAAASFLQGFINIGIVEFRREMRFDRDFKYNLTIKLSEFIPTIFIAVLFGSYWAFPLGVLSGAVIALLISNIMVAYRPRFSLKKWHSLFHFTKWVFVHEMTSVLADKFDTLLLGRMSTNQTLGLYTVAGELAAAPSTEISMPVGRAALPGLAQASHDLRAFCETNTKVLSNVLCIAIPASLGLFAVADLACLVLLGERWDGASALLQVLVFAALFRIGRSTSVAALMAYNRVSYLAGVSLISLIIRVVAVTTGFLLDGVMGVCYAVVFASVVTLVFYLVGQSNIGILAPGVLFRNIWRVSVASLAMVYIVSLVSSPLAVVIDSQVSLLLVIVLFGILIFFAMTTTLWIACGRPVGVESGLVGKLPAALTRYIT